MIFTFSKRNKERRNDDHLMTGRGSTGRGDQNNKV